MNIQLNGTTRDIPDDLLLATLLEQEGLAQRRVAVEINGEIVSRGRHATHRLRAGDVVEIVHALGGG
ncbi:sulfur carrier protein ThiS [Xanthomonas arboricola pv. populi]|uniref:Sulfur carrier protein ThiS n=1 Tax=Xanthomonas arboricola pv. populi TaxID=487823 RepID=A0A2S6Z7Z2_9XANT|nr:sulfur carrier protein ThiS [Xanthomonas arboricola]PPT77899.1 sulfur carrier protein ThiS [Xanthomonas arboricola pv. populi]